MTSLSLTLTILSVVASAIPMVNAQAPNGFFVKVDDTTGDYSVGFDDQVNENKWFSGGQVAFRAGQTTYSTVGGSLKLVNVTKSVGSEPNIGTCNVTTFYWSHTSDATPSFATSIKEFPKSSATNAFTVVFEQQVLTALSDTATGNPDDLISAFPAFTTVDTSLNYLTYAGTFAPGMTGRWGTTTFPGGSNGGTPVITYNKNGDSLLIAPLDTFMQASQAAGTPESSFAFGAGIQGMVKSLNKDYTHRTIVVGVQSKVTNYAAVAESVRVFGMLLLANSGKRLGGVPDSTITNLGYWTDNGAYYYYVTEPEKNYQDTMIDVKEKLASLNVPVQYFQYDSWWYYKGPKDGVTVWESMPNIFPSGMTPAYMNNTALTLHNRWFSNLSPYIKNYTFHVEGDYAVPTDPNLFSHIMKIAKDWGMVVYEQDWLDHTYNKMNITQDNLEVSEAWLDAMHEGAKAVDVNIQYCMPLIGHLLQSTKYDRVTQIRVSTDYNPGLKRNWGPVGLNSILLDALGVVPFKDCFWTTESQPGCKTSFPTCNEPNPELETTLAVMTTGPVGPADRIDLINATRIMRTCRADGVLLKPGVPLHTHPVAFSIGYDNVTVPDIWWSQTDYSVEQAGGNITVQWYYIISIAIQDPNLVLKGSDAAPAWAGPFLYYNNRERPTGVMPDLIPLGREDSLPIATNATVPSNQYLAPFNFYVLVPMIVADNGDQWAIVGEIEKVVPMSAQRISGIKLVEPTNTTSQLVITVQGAANEDVSIAVALVTGDTRPQSTTHGRTRVQIVDHDSSSVHTRAHRLRGGKTNTESGVHTTSVTADCKFTAAGTMTITCQVAAPGSISCPCA